MAIRFSAFIHDTDHPGFTNSFQIATESSLALTYNDKSILENHHLSTVFKLLKNKPELNIWDTLSKQEEKIFQ